MINKIIAYSIKNKFIIGLMTLALIAGGIWSMTKVPLDAVPDITNNQVQVITQAPSLGTSDIEQFITYPVELAMANLPGVIEIRSVSRFGLSVVTIVFEDDMGTYLPRQLVSEKLVAVQEEIPDGFGTPEMGPISTGLGEIYQYTLEVDSAHQGEYSLTELRTIQDWIVRRQMAMVPGVVEVNAFGGNIKQYEVAVNPDELKAIGITITDIFDALEANNQNTGGAYIEKNHYANFIRGEGLIRSLSDIEDILVANVNGVPIKIKDVATVRYGKAIRYGAFTKDGNGEAVGGMILMLKGANSNEVIKNVHKRVDQIQKSLPEGVRIVPFLDRSTLIAETTGTISKNLIEGALIVIFILVFLLGNWRGGLIVASTIPLSLLFAFILMNVFDVWANLMSLGAIDFGIIVDGAVIIVEGTVFLIHDKFRKGHTPSQKERDDVAMKASNKMMNSAFFGQLIILIVFVPILALEGVEGKMFKPMAYTFMFAMIGVMILCLTYVPMMSAWFLKVKRVDKMSWGDRLVRKIEDAYEPILAKALSHGKWIGIAAVLLFGLSVFLFSRMGGEFIPQLDEGSIAFHTMLKPGSSLSETIATTTKAENILLNNFPEVTHVFSRIGVADVPTDPMPMDIADCIVLLKPKDEWNTGRSKEELIIAMKEKLSVLPGVNYEFTQPIEMRFNELLTGVREDIAVKLFGEDLDILAQKAREMGEIISTVEGVGDMRVEATSGLPQITITYNRDKLAQYGLNIAEINRVVRTAFAGDKAGVIFEGERRFDLVVRLDKQHRNGIDNLKNLYINLDNGTQIPLGQITHISYAPGPMQISRDNTNRRVYVGINVRDRDVQSLVEEIQQKLDEQLELPPGYYIRYGGAFENLERAVNRLKIVVPIALVLIFIFIFFALKSIKQSAMIYIVIPLSAIGGVLSLWLRDMPFSISAGIGFIVLFGVAVLNGLILISSWNELKAEGVSDINTRIKLGSRRRVRPILLTALTDIFGFLPMAISVSAGAEVQRPLATVVIGGMISATLLTMFVLPVLYRWVETRKSKPGIPKSITVALIGFCTLLGASAAKAQEPITKLEDAIALGLSRNGAIEAAHTRIEMAERNKKTAWNIPQTSLGIQYGQYNSFEYDFAFEINQELEFPTVYTSRKALAKTGLQTQKLEFAATKNKLVHQIRQNWLRLAFLMEKQKIRAYQDSLYSQFLLATQMRYETEATSFLAKTTAETEAMKVRNLLKANYLNIEIAREELQMLINDTLETLLAPDTLKAWQTEENVHENILANNPKLLLAQQQVVVADAQKSIESAKLLPSLSIGYFNQSIIGLVKSDGTFTGPSDRFSGVQAGISIPLLFGAQKAEVKKAKLQIEIARTEADYARRVLRSKYEQQLTRVEKFKNSLAYYSTQALPQAELIISNATKSFENGAIDYLAYFQHLNRAIELKINYLNTLNAYNQAQIDLKYLTGR